MGEVGVPPTPRPASGSTSRPTAPPRRSRPGCVSTPKALRADEGAHRRTPRTPLQTHVRRPLPRPPARRPRRSRPTRPAHLGPVEVGAPARLPGRGPVRPRPAGQDERGITGTRSRHRRGERLRPGPPYDLGSNGERAPGVMRLRLLRCRRSTTLRVAYLLRLGFVRTGACPRQRRAARRSRSSPQGSSRQGVGRIPCCRRSHWRCRPWLYAPYRGASSPR